MSSTGGVFLHSSSDDKVNTKRYQEKIIEMMIQKEDTSENFIAYSKKLE